MILLEREGKERSKEERKKKKRRRALTLQGAIEKKSDIAIAIME